MKIKDLFPDERPREKLRQSGARAMSNAELLAVLLGSGFEGTSAMDVAQSLIASVSGKLTLLGAMSINRLMNQKGVGEARACIIAAALELGRRAFEELAIVDKRSVTSPDLVYQIMLPELKNLDHEECWALYLNRAGFLLGKEKITSGSLESTLIDRGRILRRAIEIQCTNVILVHNHPSGSPRPGEADIQQTDQLRRALSAVGFNLLDHVIVSEDSYFSFSEERVTRIK